MLTFIGILFLIIAIALLVIKLFAPEEVKTKIKNYYIYTVGIIGFVLMLFGSSIFYSEPGKQYFLVSPFGHKSMIATEGYKFIMPLSKVQEWQKFIDVKVISDKMPKEAIKEIEGKMTPVGIRFIDQVTAKVYVSTRFKLPEDEPSFIKLVLKFRTMNNLVNNTLIPTVREQIINTGYMFQAQNYISGDAQAFRQTFDEQLKSGTFVVEKAMIKDTIWEPIQTNKQRRIKEIKTKFLVHKVLENGLPKRIKHEITENNIIVSQVIVDRVALEPAFVSRLEAQRDESAKRQLEQQKIETAKTSQIKVIAEGEVAKAAERVHQEKQQVATLIAIETDKKKEQTRMELAKIALETDKLKAQAVKVTADAEAYKNKKLVVAGLTPQEKAEWEYKTKVGVAEKLAGPAGLRLPETYINSGANKGQSSQNDMMLLLINQMVKNK